MEYQTFVSLTKHMKPTERSNVFGELSEKDQTKLLDDYYAAAEKEKMFLQVRIIGAAERIEEEQEKEIPDINKLQKWIQLYDRLVEELHTT